MKKLSQFSKGELELFLRTLKARRDSKSMTLVRRIHAELDARKAKAA